MKYVYSFVVWPNEVFPHTRSLFDYFRTFRRRTEMYFTKAEFEDFRSDLIQDGFTLREVTRTPYALPENVL